MQDFPESLIKSTICPDVKALNYMLSNGFDIRMIKIQGDVWTDLDAIKRYIEYGGELSRYDFYFVFLLITDSRKLIEAISLFPADIYDLDEGYRSTYHRLFKCGSISEQSFKNFIVKIAASTCDNKLSVLDFAFDFFNKGQFENDEPWFLGDFIFSCFLKHNESIVKDLIMFIMSKFDQNVSNSMLSYIIRIYSYSPKREAVPFDFYVWSDKLLLEILSLLDLESDNKIISESIIYFPLVAVQYLYELNLGVMELILPGTFTYVIYPRVALDYCVYPRVALDYCVYPKLEIIKYLHDVGIDFTKNGNANFIDFQSEQHVMWFIETVCKSDHEIVKRMKPLFIRKSITMKHIVWQKIKETYFSSD
jgi:hypothetical protein